ncbi:T6SS immunity protein Tdi1 domain-containing protein [Mesorhizobium sophorae]|uniref:T6SS immunity protein Tdi1 domain-containing protein n=1 Tax=Mesorhizobium sophorae TaxID=1300294 RepID=UPI000BA3DA78|nr:T6SS immunity protein Tdi1 domain-containing protein [Mesorhizobium sophorae]
MFEAFRQNFLIDSRVAAEAGGPVVDSGIPGLNELLANFGGASFKRGLYRIIRAQDMPAWNARISLGFPEANGRITCFGYEWQGSAFAVDTQRLEEGQPGVLLFEPGTGEALEIPANIETFHDGLIIENADAALAASLYEEWLAAGGAQPAYDQCIGYKKPLFLGGEDDISNQELSDLEVYWHIIGQVIAKIKGRPPGVR